MSICVILFKLLNFIQIADVFYSVTGFQKSEERQPANVIKCNGNKTLNITSAETFPPVLLLRYQQIHAAVCCVVRLNYLWPLKSSEGVNNIVLNN